MKDKLFPIIISIIALIALITTIIFDIYFNKYEYKTPGNTMWIILESAILLISIVQIFFRINYVYGVLIFGDIAAIIMSLMYIILDSTGKYNEFDNIILFFVPHLIIYVIHIGIEIYYVNRYLKLTE